MPGSSPHLRGSRACQQVVCRCGRVIPAPAGQPPTSGELPRNRKGHPRTCGAAELGQGVPHQGSGSSPHLRGSPGPCANCCGWLWVIPAPAGQPTPGTATPDGGSGHPRTCGAADLVGPVVKLESGSSPHLRGSPRRSSRSRSSLGVIPAPAGQPRSWPRAHPPRWGHPRTCGAATRA